MIVTAKTMTTVPGGDLAPAGRRPAGAGQPDDGGRTRPRRPRTSEPARRPPGALRAGRVLSPVLLATGCFSLALALLLPVFVYPQLAVFPADPQALQVQEATGGTVLATDPDAPSGLRVLKDVDVKILTFVSRAPQEPDEDSVIWRMATSVYADGDRLINARFEHASLDRRTGLTNNCCDDRLFNDVGDTKGSTLLHSGYVTFPFDTQKQTYRLWDIQLRRSRAATYQGEERRDGFDTYKFVAETPLTKIGSQALPGSLFGVQDASVLADAEYADTRTFWVEPNTGGVVGMHELLHQQFSYAGKSVVAVDADLSSPNLPKALRDQARSGAEVLPWIRGRASWVLAVVGLGMLVGWYRIRNASH